MEERNALLRNNLNLLYKSNLAVIACMLLVIIPQVDLVALVVALAAVIMSIVGVCRLRGVHGDYNIAFVLSVVYIALALMGDLLGGRAELAVDVVTSVVSFAKTYYIIRGTNALLTEVGDLETAAKGERTMGIYYANLVLSIATAAVEIPYGTDAVGIALVVMVISLVVSVVAIVSFLRYLSKAQNCF